MPLTLPADRPASFLALGIAVAAGFKFQGRALGRALTGLLLGSRDQMTSQIAKS